jgi:uncharacterized membrane protein
VGYAPAGTAIAATRRFLVLELSVVAAIPLLATLMARGL